MTIRTPSWLQAGSYPAENDRLLLQSLLGGSPNVSSESPAVGCVGSADLLVTASPTPDMNVHVAPGAAFIPGSETTTQGVYGVVVDAAQAVPIAASDATNPRISLIVLQVLDQSYSGTQNIGQLVEVAGTPSPSPATPAAPKNSIVLATLQVPKLATSITAADLGDQRYFMATLASLDLRTFYDDTWTSAPLTSGWANFGGAFPGLAFRKEGRTVFVRGVVKNTSGAVKAQGSQICSIPGGYAPAASAGTQHVFADSNNTATARCDVTSAGVLSLAAGSNGGSLAANGYLAISGSYSLI